MTPQQENLIDLALGLYTKEAYQRRDNAAHNGAFNDGGCESMLDKVKAYKAGLLQMYPPFLSDVYFQKAQDPEYVKYLELKKKFGE